MDGMPASIAAEPVNPDHVFALRPRHASRLSGRELNKIVRKLLVCDLPIERSIVAAHFYRRVPLPDVAMQLGRPEGELAAILDSVCRRVDLAVEHACRDACAASKQTGQNDG